MDHQKQLEASRMRSWIGGWVDNQGDLEGKQGMDGRGGVRSRVHQYLQE